MGPGTGSAANTAFVPSAAPVFILSCARSGSTLLRFLIDSHPDFACPPECNLAALCETVCAVSRTLSGDGQDDGPALARELSEKMLARFAENAGKTRWCEKSLVSATKADLLARIWPEAVFICLYRHCMDVVASALEASPWGLASYGLAPYAAAFPSDSVAAVVAYWRDWTDATVRFEERNPDRCHRIYYEELASDPDEVLSKLWPFLGASNAPGLAERAVLEHHHAGPSDYKIWHTSAVRRDSIGRGVCVPTDRLPVSLTGATNDLLRRVGYVEISATLREVPSMVPRASIAVRGSEEPGGTNPWPLAVKETQLFPSSGTGPDAPLSDSKFSRDMLRVVVTDCRPEREIWFTGWRTLEPVCVQPGTVAERPGVTLIGPSAVLCGIGPDRDNLGAAIRSGRVRYFDTQSPSESGRLATIRAVGFCISRMVSLLLAASPRGEFDVVGHAGT